MNNLQQSDFNPRFPRGKRHDIVAVSMQSYEFQSTLPAGEATRRRRRPGSRNRHFNPRFPRGKRLSAPPKKASSSVISIHASRGGSDPAVFRPIAETAKFQSTLPAGEATRRYTTRENLARNFNPRFPRGKRLSSSSSTCGIEGFQSTLPAGEATA